MITRVKADGLTDVTSVATPVTVRHHVRMLPVLLTLGGFAAVVVLVLMARAEERAGRPRRR